LAGSERKSAVVDHTVELGASLDDGRNLLCPSLQNMDTGLYQLAQSKTCTTEGRLKNHAVLMSIVVILVLGFIWISFASFVSFTPDRESAN
jgi:hypothetical protein